MTVLLGMVLADGAFFAADSLMVDQSGEKTGKTTKLSRISEKLGAGIAGWSQGGQAAVSNLESNIEEVVSASSLDLLLRHSAEHLRAGYEEEYERYIQHYDGLQEVTVYIFGQAPDESGFLCRFRSNNGFDPELTGETNEIRGMATDLDMVEEVAAKTIDKIQQNTTEMKPLHIWAFRTIEALEMLSDEIALPAQFMLVGDQYFDDYPVESVEDVNPEKYTLVRSSN